MRSQALVFRIRGGNSSGGADEASEERSGIVTHSDHEQESRRRESVPEIERQHTCSAVTILKRLRVSLLSRYPLRFEKHYLVCPSHFKETRPSLLWDSQLQALVEMKEQIFGFDSRRVLACLGLLVLSLAYGGYVVKLLMNPYPDDD